MEEAGRAQLFRDSQGLCFDANSSSNTRRTHQSMLPTEALGAWPFSRSREKQPQRNSEPVLGNELCPKPSAKTNASDPEFSKISLSTQLPTRKPLTPKAVCSQPSGSIRLT